MNTFKVGQVVDNQSVVLSVGEDCVFLYSNGQIIQKKLSDIVPQPVVLQNIGEGQWAVTSGFHTKWEKNMCWSSREAAIAKIKETGLTEYWEAESNTNSMSSQISMMTAFDDYCRHNYASYPEIGDLRNAPHWFKVTSVKRHIDYKPEVLKYPKDFQVGNTVLVTDGYVTNVSLGWTFDPIPNRTHGSGGSHWQKWESGYCCWARDVNVRWWSATKDLG